MSPSKSSSTSSPAKRSGAATSASTSTSASSPPAVTSESAASAGYHKGRMQNAREALLTGSVYLGEPGATNNVAWVRVGKGGRLVTKEVATEYKSSSDLSAADPDSFTLTNPDSAILSAVVLIPEENYWLTADANWKGPSTVAPKLSDAKASCTGQAPDNEIFLPDFATMLTNIQEIMEKGRTRF